MMQKDIHRHYERSDAAIRSTFRRICFMDCFALLAMTLLLICSPAIAFVVEKPLADAAQEAHAQELFHQFRCVVCQSESVADSPADVAKDVRTTIRRQVAAGKSDAEISDALVASYGEFILMQPRFTPHNYLLWLTPVLLLLMGVLLLIRTFKAPKQ